MKVGINGLGRIGRCLVRAITSHNCGIELVRVNGMSAVETFAHLLQYDSVHGKFAQEVVSAGNSQVKIGATTALYSSNSNVQEIDWGDAELVFECTGKFNEARDAAHHIKQNVTHVVLSGPSKSADSTIVYGVNNSALKSSDRIISPGSCTTNALAPIALVIDREIGIAKGHVTTVHSYTNDQNLFDNNHKDLRRARSAPLSIVPSTTGLSQTLARVMPNVASKISSSSIRVPTPNVSLIDCVFSLQKGIKIEQVHEFMKRAEASYLAGVLQCVDVPLVSIDFNGNAHSAIFDATETVLQSEDFLRVLAWYDNEWGFVHRMIDLAKLVR